MSAPSLFLTRLQSAAAIFSPATPQSQGIEPRRLVEVGAVGELVPVLLNSGIAREIDSSPSTTTASGPVLGTEDLLERLAVVPERGAGALLALGLALRSCSRSRSRSRART